MADEISRRPKLTDHPVVSFRTGWQTLRLLDSLAQLQGSSRSRIINTALWQYATDYAGARGHVSQDPLRTRLRRTDILQKRIEINLNLGQERRAGELEQDRRDMLDEAYHYARYTSSFDTYRLLSRTADWLAHSFENATPAPENLTQELRELLKAQMEAHQETVKQPEVEKGPKQTPL